MSEEYSMSNNDGLFLGGMLRPLAIFGLAASALMMSHNSDKYTLYNETRNFISKGDGVINEKDAIEFSVKSGIKLEKVLGDLKYGDLPLEKYEENSIRNALKLYKGQ